MAKKKTVFFCNSCGNEAARWSGKCPACGAWNSMTEEVARSEKRSSVRGKAGLAPQPPVPVTEIPLDEGERCQTGIGEFDRILGGGIVEGSVTLLGGEPGVGKSTLLLQIAHRLASMEEGSPVLYVTGEESARQTRMRAERLGACSDRLLVQCETDVDAILGALDKTAPRFAVVDSIQTIASAEIASAPGSVSQIRESAARLVRYAKDTGLALFFIGHVTKEGTVAGPRLLEHMVDTVLYFEGERHFSYRILRAVKNRFGSTNEIGIFDMGEQGLQAVLNPSEMFLSERPESSSGSVVLAAIEGTRPLLVEVQALVTAGGGFGAPRRSSHGMDVKRLALILAVLEKRIGLSLSSADVFVNFAGGLRVDEPAMDLAVAAAVASSALDTPIEKGAVVFGEIGLAGEIRSVGQMEKRFNEIRRLGFEFCVYGAPTRQKTGKEAGLQLYPASFLKEGLRFLGLDTD